MPVVTTEQDENLSLEKGDKDMKGMQVIDVDSRLAQLDDDSDVRQHMGPPFSGVARAIFPDLGWDPACGRRFGIREWELDTYIRAMDQMGIDGSILFPTRGMLVSQIPETGLSTGDNARDKDIAAVYCQGYNRYVADICKQSPRLKAVGIAPFRDVPAAMDEIKRLVGDLGLVGVAVSSLGLSKHLGSATYWPIYDEMQRLDVPLLVHNPSYEVPPWHRLFDTFLLQDTVGGSMETLHVVAALLFGGIPERFPNLRVGIFNVGVGWIPYMMERLDSYGERMPLLSEQPSEYMKKGSWFYACLGSESTLPSVLDWVGADAVMFGSAYPDADCDFPNAVSSFQQRRDIPEEAKTKILGENAKRLFRLRD